MYNKYVKLFLLSLIAWCVSTPVVTFGETISPNIQREIEQGNIKEAIDSCAETLYTSDNESENAKLNVIISMLLLLDQNPNATDRLNAIQNFMLDKSDPDEKNARTLLGYLGKQISGNKLIEQMRQADPNWQATALVARYIRILKELGVKPKLLNQCIIKYMEISDKLQPEDWGNIWKKRMIFWHNSLQNKDENMSGLEPLIAKAKEDALNGPLKEQLAEINKIIIELLQNKKITATKDAKRALVILGPPKRDPANIPYAKLLDYLGGAQITPKELFQSTIQHPDFFLLTTIAVVVKKMSDAKPGDISKSELITYLDNYDKNINNTQQELVLKWQPLVKKWEKWCSADFPYSPSLKPLTAAHSRAIAVKNKEKLARQAALAVYSKLKMSQSLNRVSMNDYKKMRVLFSNRPHPASMEFTNTSMKDYVSSLPLELQQGEWSRIRYMNVFKKNMIDNLNFSQYHGSIRLKSRSITGKVLKADNNFITIKSSYGTKKYKWGDIKPDQYITFTENYIKNNIGGKVRGKDNMFSSMEATGKVLAKEYRMLAIFCDWYGKYPEALKFGKKADTYPSSRGATCKLLLQ